MNYPIETESLTKHYSRVKTLDEIHQAFVSRNGFPLGFSSRLPGAFVAPFVLFLWLRRRARTAKTS